MVTVNLTGIGSIIGRGWTRKVLIDVYPSATAGMFDIVVRGEDKVLAGAKPSQSADPQNAKEHKPALAWNDESATARTFTIATSDDEGEARKLANDLLGYWEDASAPDHNATVETVTAYTSRYLASLSPEASTLAIALIGIGGAYVKSACKYGSYEAELQRERDRAAGNAAKLAKQTAKADADALRAALQAKDAQIAAMMRQLEALSAGSAPAAPVIPAADVAALLANLTK